MRGTSGGRSSPRPTSLLACATGCREEKWYGTAGVPGYFRKPYGKGWALVGDASYNRDPITAQGISDAFIEAEMLATALSTVWSGAGTLEDRLAAHRGGAQRTRATDV